MTVLFRIGMYGITITLYAICAHKLWAQMTGVRRKNMFFLYYITIVTFLGTLYTISITWSTDLSFVKHRLYLDGLYAYFILVYSQPTLVVGNVANVLINFMADGLVVSLASHHTLILYLPAKRPSTLQASACSPSCKHSSWAAPCSQIKQSTMPSFIPAYQCP